MLASLPTAFDEGSVGVGEWRGWITSDLIGDRPRLNMSMLRAPKTQPEASGDDLLDDHEAVSEVLQQIVQGESRKVVALLKERWGHARFFASLYAAGKFELNEYPLTEEMINAVVNYDLTGSKLRTWAWVDGDEMI